MAAIILVVYIQPAVYWLQHGVASKDDEEAFDPSTQTFMKRLTPVLHLEEWHL